MKTFNKVLLSVITATFLVACGGGSSSTSGTNNPGTQTGTQNTSGQQDSQEKFTKKELLDNTYEVHKKDGTLVTMLGDITFNQDDTLTATGEHLKNMNLKYWFTGGILNMTGFENCKKIQKTDSSATKIWFESDAHSKKGEPIEYYFLKK
ncbi:MAG: hypothetical protein CSA86_05470 [Arcobacter sp.]|nr:MAG: hypothetical protein CSA86_05470 [Arcobacter sp.]